MFDSVGTAGGVAGRGRRRALVCLAALALSLLTLEAGLRWLGGWSPERARTRIEGLLAAVQGTELETVAQDRPRPNRNHLLHPYTGFDARQAPDLAERYVALHRGPDRDERFTILFCGASVTEIFVGVQRGGSERLVELLRADERLEARKIDVCRLAGAGFKQPQQLMKLAYYFARGCEPDVVVNIDGLNDVHLGVRNLLQGLHPTWPSGGHWLHLAVGPAGDAQVWDAYVTARETQARLMSRARAALERGFTSAILGRVRVRDLERRYARWLVEHEAYVERLHAAARPRAVTDEERDAAAELCVETWAASSRMMHELCERRGALYLHLLQPTLHDVGSKIVSAEEQAGGIGESGVDPAVGGYYDRLRAAGTALAAEGIAFVDTSRVFAEVEETLYFDRSHFGREGNRILAEHIAKAILTRL